jgi:hypothetical protein
MVRMTKWLGAVALFILTTVVGHILEVQADQFYAHYIKPHPRLYWLGFLSSGWWRLAVWAILFFGAFYLGDRKRTKQHHRLPELRPKVRPFAYEKEARAYGLTIVNPGYAASDVHIPPVPIEPSGYTLIFPERVPLLTERDHHRFLVARLEHLTQPGLDGGHLLGVMRLANIASLKFAIVYKDDESREYKSNCAIKTDSNVPGGLTVTFLNQELL